MSSRNQEKRALALCCVTHGVQDGISGTLYVLIPLLAEALGLNYAQVGLIRATRSATTSLFELPSGLLAERFGERRLLAFGLVSAGAGYLWLSTATGLALVLASLVVAGIGAAFQHALSSSVISTTFPIERRRSALGLFNSAGDAGKLLFTGLFSLLVGIGVAWTGIVAAFGGIAVLLAIVLLIAMRAIGVGERAIESGDGKDTPAETRGWGIHDRGGFGALCSVVYLDTAVQTGFLVFLAFLIADKDVPTEWASFAVVVTLVGGMFGKAGCGYLAERLGVRRSLVLTQCATAAGIVALVAAPALLAFFVLPVLGMFLQGSTSITYGSVGDFIRSDRQSRGFGVIYSVASVASVTGPILFGFIGDYLGLASAMWAMAFFSVLTILPSALLGARS